MLIRIAVAVVLVAGVFGVIRLLTLHTGAGGKAFGAVYIAILAAAILGAGVAGILYYSRAQKAVLEEPR
ncbi:MAG: hypothetical protein HYY18_22090 [Planctomycetes bacterium]|nr:hypothetical protein [Planctomycetota bacterium]